MKNKLKSLVAQITPPGGSVVYVADDKSQFISIHSLDDDKTGMYGAAISQLKSKIGKENVNKSKSDPEHGQIDIPISSRAYDFDETEEILCKETRRKKSNELSLTKMAKFGVRHTGFSFCTSSQPIGLKVKKKLELQKADVFEYTPSVD